MHWHDEAELVFRTPVPLGSFVRILVPLCGTAEGSQEDGAAVQAVQQQVTDMQPGAPGSVCWPVNSAACHLVCHKVDDGSHITTIPGGDRL